MNQAQQKYAIDRIDHIRTERRQAIFARYAIKAVRHSQSERRRLIAAGKATLKSEDHHGYLYESFSYPGERDAGIEPSGQKLLDALDYAATKARDEVMLGSEDGARAAIAALAGFVVPAKKQAP